MATTPFEEPVERPRIEIVRAQVVRSLDPAVRGTIKVSVALIALGGLISLAPLPWNVIGVIVAMWLALAVTHDRP